MATKNFIEELEWRGMIHTIMPGAKEQLEKEMTTAYLDITLVDCRIALKTGNVCKNSHSLQAVPQRQAFSLHNDDKESCYLNVLLLRSSYNLVSFPPHNPLLQSLS